MDETASVSQSGQSATLDFQKEFEETLKSLAVLLAKISTRELTKAMENKNIQDISKSDLSPYLAAVFTLAFTGKDIDKENISRLIKSLGLIPRTEILEKLSSVHFKNNLIYAAAVYFLFLSNRELNVENIMVTIRALELHPDSEIAGYVLTLYKLYKGATL